LPVAPPEPILVAAVSARMLAELATNAGHRVVAADRFGDLDLRRTCPTVVAAEGGLEALARAARGVEAPSVVYGAGFENHPRLVGRLAEGRVLLGNPPETLARVRDPAALGAALRGAGHPFPRTFAAAEAAGRAERARRWLRKPLRGGAGRGVRDWRGGRLAGDVVLQERVDGLACSAAAVGDGRGAALLGVSEQLIGVRAFGARGYRWCGNVVPPRLDDGERAALGAQARDVCACLAEAFGLRGLFGVDLVWDGARAWTVEVNPRPCGSLETIEAAYGTSVFAAHLDGCAGRLPASVPSGRGGRGGRGPSPAAGKAILYATHDVVAGDTSAWPRAVRDVPHPGERIARTQPVCTLTAVAPTPEVAYARLEEDAARMRAELRRPGVAAHA
jgi:predicted ATP-grasp superfamily ATP-dependent carboligase